VQHNKDFDESRLVLTQQQQVTAETMLLIRLLQYALNIYAGYMTYDYGWNESTNERFFFSGFLFAEAGTSMFSLFD
jgi:hypothetical protein